VRRTRRWNAANLGRYFAALEGGRLPPGAAESVDPATAAAERAILRLRTSAGLLDTEDLEPHTGAAIGWARAEGLLERADPHVLRLTRHGRLLADELFVRLLPPAATEAA
jgi:coproporphyrinogen III oxidase-like Fe-S oxidoreductase